ncbi:MAG: hypothetical protein EBV06_04895 [Planctomycetia bacterium]|nr:hypothetical protein [Planctomycetia bacterium]
MRTGLFALTLFIASALSFVAQPMIGKRLLPLMGGTPGVWAACLVFFQVALLLGYLYAHRIAVVPRVHLLTLPVVLLAFGVSTFATGQPLPVIAEWLPRGDDYPFLPLLATLTLAIGVPFVVLTATAPLLMRWYGDKEHSYALYSASNLGSLLGLFGYPLLVEPWLNIAAQQQAWAVGVSGCLILIGCCALWSSKEVTSLRSSTQDVPLYDWLTWTGLAALPAALLTSVSSVLTAEVAPVPMLWVVPLALYLVSFIVVFSGWSEGVHRVVWRVSTPLILLVSVVLLTRAADPIWLVGALHLSAFVGICFVCHGELVLRRPPAERLTLFTLALAAGGAAGGLLVGLVAPLLFARLGMIEYPLALVVACLVRPHHLGHDDNWRTIDVAYAVVIGLLTLMLIISASYLPEATENSEPLIRLAKSGLKCCVPVVATFALVWRRWRFAMSLAAVFLASAADESPSGTVLYTERTFFGTVQVVRSRDGRFVRLVHGATQHGQQRADQRERPTPLLYYHPSGPIGRLFRVLPPTRTKRVGVIGMGCGAMAAYGREGERWTFFEIDPAVIRIAQDERYFTFLATCAAKLELDAGDGRQRLALRDELYDVLVLDAFNSDAIPTHLLTREAMGLYLDRLAANGLLVFHVSNRYLDLPPLLARLAAERGLVWRVDHDTISDPTTGKLPSSWVVVARDEEALALLDRDRRWERTPVRAGMVWTDHYSPLLAVWRREE